MSTADNAKAVMDMLTAIEDRNVDTVVSHYHPEIEFHWPPPLPYSGTYRGREVHDMTAKFAAVWAPLRQTAAERHMDSKIVASEGDDVVARYIWRGRARSGARFETETLAHYRFRDGKLAQAEMFYFDLPGMVEFLKSAEG